MSVERTLAAVLDAPNQLHLRLLPLPAELQPHQVLLRTAHVGLCASDVKYWRDGACGRFRLDGRPLVLGHEASAVVQAVGRQVTQVAPGDRVAVEPGLACGRCRQACLTGRYNLCEAMRFCATPPVHGTLAEYVVHEEAFCHRLPDQVDLRTGALVEPLAVAVYACERGLVGPASSVLIFGAGPVGLMSLAVARQLGAGDVTVVDIDTRRLAAAQRLGASGVESAGGKREDALLEALARRGRWDAVLECSGADQSLRLGLELAASGGRVVMVGRGSAEPSLRITSAAMREVDLVGVFRYANCFPKAISLLASGVVDLDCLITHELPLIEVERAFSLASSSASSGALKVLVTCSDDRHPLP